MCEDQLRGRWFPWLFCLLIDFSFLTRSFAEIVTLFGLIDFILLSGVWVHSQREHGLGALCVTSSERPSDSRGSLGSAPWIECKGSIMLIPILSEFFPGTLLSWLWWICGWQYLMSATKYWACWLADLITNPWFTFAVSCVQQCWDWW